MLFNSYEFIFLFLPVAFIVFYLIAGKNHSGALACLAFVSLFSYGYWSLYALPILIGYIIFNYSLALCLANPDASRSCRFIAKLTVLFEDFIRFKIRKSMSN